MLQEAIKWRDRLTAFKSHSDHPENVQKHIEILDYLIENTEIVEENLPLRAEVSE